MAVVSYSSSHPNMGARPSNGVLLSLALREDGTYVIFAKLNLNNNASLVKSVTCHLKAGERDSAGVFDPATVDEDLNVIRLAESGEKNLDMAAVPFVLQHTFDGNAKDKVNCIQLIYNEEPAGTLVWGGRAKITAIKVDGSGYATFCP